MVLNYKKILSLFFHRFYARMVLTGSLYNLYTGIRCTTHTDRRTDRYHTHTHTHSQTDTTHTHTDTGSLYNLYTGIRYTTHTDRQTDK